MPKRRELKGIASGIASSFVSRNNDVDGYWGLGIFYKLASELGSNSFSLNLGTGESVPEFRFSKRAAEAYHALLIEQLQKKGFDQSKVQLATVDIEFNVPPTKRQVMFKSTWGEPFVCRVYLKDDLNKVWRSEFRGWCGIHDPAREQRSIRRYAS